MKRLKCEEELAKIVKEVGQEYGFELDKTQGPFLVVRIASWIDEHFGLEEDPILKRIKTHYKQHHRE